MTLTPYHHSDAVTLYTADATTGLAALADASVDCLVTSPPYWRLRDYGAIAGGQEQIGLEGTIDAYVSALRAIFAEARRVLAPEGTVWINLGDSYSLNSDGYWRTNPGPAGQPHYRARSGLPHKNLLGMPWRVALALQEDGWILRSAIVWNKPDTTPTPIRDRLTTRHEMIFLFVTQPDHYFNLHAARQPYVGDRSLSRRTHRGGNPGNVWTIPPDRSRAGHPAPFPAEIPRRCIAAGCPTGGHVLDPFSGAATTGIAARELGCRFTGIDINPEFHALGLRRLGLRPSATEGAP